MLGAIVAMVELVFFEAKSNHSSAFGDDPLSPAPWS
jgi:hypothetical protein